MRKLATPDPCRTDPCPRIGLAPHSGSWPALTRRQPRRHSGCRARLTGAPRTGLGGHRTRRGIQCPPCPPRPPVLFRAVPASCSRRAPVLGRMRHRAHPSPCSCSLSSAPRHGRDAQARLATQRRLTAWFEAPHRPLLIRDCYKHPSKYSFFACIGCLRLARSPAPRLFTDQESPHVTLV